ncbi:MAG: NADP-dependent oxidoreductase [Thermoactinospora sp.]|nr:NADP-dependent oxidoreductase [Thermoactinospora sp.]
MRAVVVRGYGGPEALEVADLPLPEPGPGQVRVRIEAASVNPLDVFVRTGGMQAAGMAEPRESTGLGVDLAGVVDAAGPEVDGLRPGDRVIGLSLNLAHDSGTYAEYCVVDPAVLTAAPQRASAQEAAGLPLGGMTALVCLGHLALQPGSTLLVTGAAGNVGGLLTQLASRRGIRVVAVARPSDEDLVRGFGAAFFVEAGDGLADAVRAVVPGGVDAAVDPAVVVGQAHASVRDGGQFLSLVMHGMPEEGRDIKSTVVWAYPDPARLAELSSLVDEGALRLRVARTFPLEEAGTAHALLEQGGVRGKLVIVP